MIRFGTDCLAGVPSIIFGLFGFVFFVIYLNMGWSILSGGLTLAAMILPTIISTAEEAIKAIPKSYREVSYSLGGTKWQTVTQAVLPSALPGIFTGIILSVGRSIGETAARHPDGRLLPVDAHLPLLSDPNHVRPFLYPGAREGISMEMAYGTGAALILLVLFVNTIAHWLHQPIYPTAESEGEFMSQTDKIIIKDFNFYYSALPRLLRNITLDIQTERDILHLRAVSERKDDTPEEPQPSDRSDLWSTDIPERFSWTGRISTTRRSISPS